MKNHFFILLIFFSSASAQKVSIDSLLIGAWKGTSICQIKPSACNDEIAVYHVSKGNQPNIYHIVMNKVINEEEEGMAVYDYTFNAQIIHFFAMITDMTLPGNLL